MSQNQLLASKLKAAGVQVTLIVVDGRGWREGPGFSVEIIAFFDKYLKPGSAKQ